ncbi:MAG TPA: hypothetical protein VJ885_17010 [Thermoanaerobaculia bacterium]|nr:hypothetical protein [Thermoanaerobaculia bacterium]
MMRVIRAIVVFTLTLGLAAAGAWAQTLLGDEIRVSPRTAGSHLGPDVAAGPDGRFVVVWHHGSQQPGPPEPSFVMARLFDAAGQPLGRPIRVARQDASHWTGPVVGMAADGSFVVIWSAAPDDPVIGYGRRFDADGRPLGRRFPLGRNTAIGQEQTRDMDLAMAPDGSFVLAWAAWVRDLPDHGVDTDVYFRRFDPDGRPRGSATLAFGGGDEQSGPRVALQPDGSFVIVSQSWHGEGSWMDVLARRFSRTGAPLGPEIRVESPTWTLDQVFPDVAVAADGSFAITWTDAGADFERGPGAETQEDFTGIAVQLYAANGTPRSPVIQVNTFLPRSQMHSVIGALPGGGFRIVWWSEGDQDGDGLGIFSQVVGRDGELLLARERLVNVERSGDQSAPALAIAPSGKGAVVWVGPDGDDLAVLARRIGRSGS